MKAGEISLEAALDGVRQYHVPLFQRAYSWKERNWSELWNDVIETVASSTGRKHFFGAIVSKSETLPQSSVTRYLLIDGQQRLTTVFIMLCALRDQARAQGNDEMADDIEQELLFNHRKKGDDYFKLWPTRDDRSAFEAVMRGQATPTNAKGNAVAGSHPIVVTLVYFRRKMMRPGAPSLEEIKEALLKRFEIVAVQLGADDDPYRIFESLNAKGERLAEADLIRNYFLMRVAPQTQEALYAQLWQPMQSALGEKISDFVRHFLSQDGDLVNKGDVYYQVREVVQGLKTESDVEGYLRDIASYADFYARFLQPQREPDAQVRASLDRLRRIQTSVCYPFLLQIFAARQSGQIDIVAVRESLEIVESFILRRWVCSVPTFGLNKIFPPLWRECTEAVGGDLKHLNEGLRHILAAKKCPGDDEFQDNLVNSPLYGSGDRLQKIHVILERLESSYEHKESVPLETLSIEHLMPQTLTEQWQEDLGADWQSTHEIWLHTLGNLTLTAYNSELSNAPWTQKQAELRQSHLELNRRVAENARWESSTIAKRGERLAERCLKIWPALGDAGAASAARGVSNTVPIAVQMMEQSFPVASWREVAQLTLETVAELSPESFEEVARLYPAYLSLDASELRVARALNNGWYMETNLDANKLHRLAERAARRASWGIDDWAVEYHLS